MRMKIIVAHPAQQHSYRLAAALKKSGHLYKYITTVYCKPHSLTKAVASILPGKFKSKANHRRCAELEDDDVVQFCEGEGLLKLLALNTPILRKKYRQIKYHTADRFAKKVADYALALQVDAVICYDDCSPLLFEQLRDTAPHILRIMDMSAANLLYMRAIYEDDLKMAPAFSSILLNERRSVWDERNVNRTKRELEAAEYFLVPSEFVRDSLLFSGIKENQIFICPYGVDVKCFTQKEYPPVNQLRKRAIRFVYVGGVKELKGIYYLLEAFLQIPKEQAELTVVGGCDLEKEELKKYIQRVRFTGSVLHEKMPEILKEHDVFVFPSLGEGQSLSVLEAAACGLPLIVSVNSGIGKIVEKMGAGFLIPIQSIDAIREKIEFFIQHPEQIISMGNIAREMALSYTWAAYDARIKEWAEKAEANTHEYKP